MPSSGGVANFRISLAEGVRELSAPVRERVEVRAHGCDPVEISVAIEAFVITEREANDAPGADARAWLEIAGWGAALAAAAGLLLYLV
jgi:hypothetical protein